MYFVFQNKTPTQTTHQHTYHPRLHNKAIEEYLCDPCHPSLATRPILVLLTSLQSLWHASQEVLQIRISFPRAHISIRCQQLRNRLFELEGGDDFVILQILEFPDGQIFPQLGPHILHWIQISHTRWENHSCQTMLVVLIVNSQESLIITPDLQPLGASTLVNNKTLDSHFYKVKTEPTTQV